MRPRLTFGYLFDFRNPSEFARPAAELYAETLDLIAWTEGIGFEGAWIPEHHVADDGYMPAPNLILAAIAARTSRIRIGSAVALAPLYDPVRFAEECAVLDILSGGRVEMALAIGYRRREYDAFGLPFGQRGARFDEFLEIVRRLWAGETVDHAGTHFQIRGARLTPPAPRGRIPLFIGGFAEKALERVARHSDGYFGNEAFAAPYAAKLAAVGKDPATMRIRLQYLTTVIAEDPAAAMEELAPYYLAGHNAYARGQRRTRSSGCRACSRWISTRTSAVARCRYGRPKRQSRTTRHCASACRSSTSCSAVRPACRPIVSVIMRSCSPIGLCRHLRDAARRTKLGAPRLVR